MKVGILTTNGGPHPAWKWAEQSAAQIVDIIQIEPNSLAFDELNAQKTDFEKEISAALLDHHTKVQTHEKDAIVEHGMDRLSHPIAPEEDHLLEAVDRVIAIAKTKLFGSHFSKPEVQTFVKDTLGSHFSTVRHIERSWHADRNPDAPEAQAFKAQYHPGLNV
ncbi:MAG: hypothetical protein ACXV2C_00265 [Candidatus Bathyarchaeia archaeon]